MINTEKFHVNCGYIQLSKDKWAICDIEDVDKLKSHNWYALYNKNVNDYYAVTYKYQGKKPNGKYHYKTIGMHRIIMDEPKNKFVDHINHNPLDNRRCNLRIVTPRQNNQNRKGKKTSNYPGVSWRFKEKKWRAQITINGNKKHLGYFNNEYDAANAYRSECEKIGEEAIRYVQD